MSNVSQTVMLTPGRAAVLGAMLRQPHPTTFREVCAATGLSLQRVSTHLRALRDLGLIDFEDNRSHTLHPLVECVAVGTP